MSNTDLTNCGVEGLTFTTAFVFGDDFRLDHEGFHYKGELITDAGKAYNAFMEFMGKTNNPLRKANNE